MAESMKPHRKYEHLYAIVRFDLEAAADVPVDLRVTVKKVVTDPAYAAQEVERLNRLNADKGVCYFAQITRFEAPPASAAAVLPSVDFSASPAEAKE